MPSAYDESRYLARTFAASLLDLAPDEQSAVLAFLRDELKRLSIQDRAQDKGDGDATIAPFAQDFLPDDRPLAQANGSKRS